MNSDMISRKTKVCEIHILEVKIQHPCYIYLVPVLQLSSNRKLNSKETYNYQVNTPTEATKYRHSNFFFLPIIIFLLSMN